MTPKPINGVEKYLHLEIVSKVGCITKYSWLGHSIQVIEYEDNTVHPFPWQLWGIGIFSSLNELDNELEKLWKQEQLKEGHSD